MREKQFRGRHIMSGIWFYGYLLGTETIGQVERIVGYDGVERPEVIKHCKVDKNTIGQYTGINDKNGNEIYEGDILQQPNSRMIFKVENMDGCGVYPLNQYSNYGFEVIGNIYQNPELLK